MSVARDKKSSGLSKEKKYDFSSAYLSLDFRPSSIPSRI
jgi:hypothetical protein